VPDLHVDVIFSGIWQMTSTVIVSGRMSRIDPATSAELADIAARIPKRATVEALCFTHSHWDHVVGHGIFPAVPVYTSSVLACSVAEGGELAVKGMAKAREYDSQWYVERPWGYTWPPDLRGLDDGGWFNVGDLDIEAFLIPGHAPDCMAIRAENHLLVGDYLSPCEIPFVDNLADHRRTLKRQLPHPAGHRHGDPATGRRVRADARCTPARIPYLTASPTVERNEPPPH
jgi:glyoxylase-like metal-dependent hydrolase (beta-lactamase superfamily II)